jgi:hypothetical protein
MKRINVIDLGQAHRRARQLLRGCNKVQQIELIRIMQLIENCINDYKVSKLQDPETLHEFSNFKAYNFVQFGDSLEPDPYAIKFQPMRNHYGPEC